MRERVNLIGMGCGTGATVTRQAEEALLCADLILGSSRLLSALPERYPGARIVTVTATEQAALIAARPEENICVLFSGDSGFYSGAGPLKAALDRRGIPCELLPGISSVQALAARLGRAWQDWELVSAHGRRCDIVAHVCGGRPVCVLTDGAAGSPAALCRDLSDAGLGGLTVTVGEALTGARERIRTGPARALAGQTFTSPALLLIESAPRCGVTVPGIPDDAFVRGKVPMTKQEVRCLLPAKLGLRRSDLCWDIGAGTGSISVELALQSRQVWAVEQDGAALALLEENRTRFCCWNLHIVPGTAPGALDPLPAPDAVVIGGSGGRLEEIIQTVLDRNPKARLCVTAVSLETLSAAVTALRAQGMEPDICQIAASRAKLLGTHHLMTAQNPVYLISGVRA